MKSRASRELGGLDRTCPAPPEGEPRIEDCCHRKVASVARISNSSREVDSLGFYVNAPFFFFMLTRLCQVKVKFFYTA